MKPPARAAHHEGLTMKPAARAADHETRPPKARTAKQRQNTLIANKQANALIATAPGALTTKVPEHKARRSLRSRPALADAIALAASFAHADKADNTRKAYRTDFTLFQTFCLQHRVSPLPAAPQTLAAFLATESRRCKPSTIERRLAAIRYAHKLAGLATPTDDERVKATARGIRRTIGGTKTRKAPITDDTLRAIVATLPATANGRQPDRAIADLRDRALLLLGFAGAFRRSELVALNVSDVIETTEGLRVTIRRSKTSLEATTIAIPRGKKACPVLALKTWLAAAGISRGALFRRVNKASRVLPHRLTAQSVALIVKAHAKHAGLDPEQFSAHSLRAGFLTSAARRGASLFKMMDVSRHRSLATLKGYIRDGALFADHAGKGLL